MNRANEKDVTCSACPWQGYTDEETEAGRCPKCGGRLDAIVRPVLESEERAAYPYLYGVFTPHDDYGAARQERLVTIQFRIASRDFGARATVLERALIQAAENAQGAFQALGFTAGPYRANTVGVPEANYIVHEHEGHPPGGADHKHAYDGPHEHPRMGLGAIRTAIADAQL